MSHQESSPLSLSRGTGERKKVNLPAPHQREGREKASPPAPRLREEGQICARRQQGLATVEFAIVGAVFLLLIIAILQLGLAMYFKNHVTNVARDAARYAALHGSTAPTPATTGSIQSYVLTRSSGMVDTSRLTVTTTWLPNNNPGSAVRVQVQYPFPLTIPFVPAETLTLQGSSQMTLF